jgi:hypothetical protein
MVGFDRDGRPLGPAEYLQSRTYGWDTSNYLGVAGGAGASGGVGASVGLSRTWELWHTTLSRDVMTGIRLFIVGAKMALNVGTLSPVSFIRDAMGIVPLVQETATARLLAPLLNIEIPFPGGS